MAGGHRFGVGTQIAKAGAGQRCTLGEVILNAGSVANGVPADGQLLSISANEDLYKLLGIEFGGDGKTTFGLPNLRSATPNGLTYSVCTHGDPVFPQADQNPRPQPTLQTTHRFGTDTQKAVAGSGRSCTLGEIILNAGSVANGVPADGQILSIESNLALYSLYGNRYGGNHRTTFAVPNLGRAAPSGLTYSYCNFGRYPEAAPGADPNPGSTLVTTHRFGVGTQTAVAGTGRLCTIGQVTPTAGSVANGVPANGQLVTVKSNSLLFFLLGTQFGGGGKTHFSYPNLGGVAPSGLTYALCTAGVFPQAN